MNAEQALPAENQWDLSVEYGHGLALGFHALWVESDDAEELARLLRVNPGSRLECDLGTMRDAFVGPRESVGPREQAIWMGWHAPGWTHIFLFGMYSSYPAISNLGKRRVFQMKFTGEVGEGLQPLYLDYDGESVGEIYLPLEEGGYMILPEYRPFTTGLISDEDTPLEQDVHLMWCLIGRITGRFADREWWTPTCTFYRIPEGSWET